MRTLLACLLLLAALPAQPYASTWADSLDRTWVGPDLWANRLQDWRVAKGRLECVTKQARLGMRTVHLVTHQLATSGGFTMSVRLGLQDAPVGTSPDCGGGFLIGAGAGMDPSAAAIIHQWRGPGAGLFCGVDRDGRVFFADREQPQAVVQRAGGAVANVAGKEIRLALTGTRAGGGRVRLQLAATTADGSVVSALALQVRERRCVGNVALASDPGGGRLGSGRWWFGQWQVAGDGVRRDASRRLGPIICTQHILSRGSLRMTAQLHPLGSTDIDHVRLLVLDPTGDWRETARAKIVSPGWTATFEVGSWSAARDVPYRVEYDLAQRSGGHRVFSWTGTVRKDPTAKAEIVVAGFTGNHNCSHRIGAERTDWPTVMWFPHQAIRERVAQHAPDLLFFSGDQIYEGRSPTFADRAHIHLDYLYKWYLWCWAYRDLTKDIPCVTIPDDHDVFQGNLWGEGGRKARRDVLGGYVHPADFVQMVERTQTSHLPRSPHTEPLAQGITAYYSSINYGRIGFAVLEDRKFKSGCGGGRLPDTGTRRADHMNSPDVDPKMLDVPGMKLLGDDQLAFLNEWSADWRGHDMKIALSQTVFAGMATHHGGDLMRVRCDLDSNGWPQSGRNRALRALRRGFIFHLAGDQHLGSIVHHGIDTWRDAGWSFCVPSIANFYPRKWMPEAEGANRRAGAPGWQGDHLDGLGNHVSVFAATNPGRKTGRDPADLHDKMPGYGIVRMNKNTRAITMECWPRYAVPGTDAQYPGWPRTIKQTDNDGRKRVASLPGFSTRRMSDPVVQVIDERTGGMVYALRIRGRDFHPWVYDLAGTYTVKVGDPDRGVWRTLTGLKPTHGESSDLRDLDL